MLDDAADDSDSEMGGSISVHASSRGQGAQDDRDESWLKLAPFASLNEAQKQKRKRLLGKAASARSRAKKKEQKKRDESLILVTLSMSWTKREKNVESYLKTDSPLAKW